MKKAKWFDRQGRPSGAFPNNAEIKGYYMYCNGLAAVVSLTMLQMPKVIKVLEDEFGKVANSGSMESSATPQAEPIPPVSSEDFYIRNDEAITSVTNCLQESAGTIPSCSLAVAGWAFLLQKISQLVREHTEWDAGDENTPRAPKIVEAYTEIIPKLFPTTVEVGLKQLFGRISHQLHPVVIAILESTSESGSGAGFSLKGEEDYLRMKNVVAALVRKTTPYYEFCETLINATFLSHDVEYQHLSDYSKFVEGERPVALEESWIGSPVEKFSQDDETLKLLLRAKNRFPYEPLPFLRLLRGISTESSAVINYLTNLDTYTHILPAGFKEYDDFGPEESGNIRLVTDLLLFPPRERGMLEHEVESGNMSSDGGLVINRGTQGVQISSGGTRQVVAWRCKYNGLSLLGRILECKITSQELREDLTNDIVASEIVSLLTVLIATSPESQAAARRAPGHYELPQALGEASDMLGRNRDVISLVFDLLDTQLGRINVEDPFFTVGLDFVNSLVHVAPGRVWPYLARSVLLERHGRGGAFSGYLCAVEVTQGNYDFTLANLTLFESLVEEAIRSSAVHKGRSRALVLSSKAPEPSGPGGNGVSDIVQREILLGYTRVIVDIFESYRGFKYSKDIAQKLQIGTRIARIFNTILYYAYGVDEFSDSENKLTSVLMPSAEYLVSVFLGQGENDLPIEPILGAIQDGVATPESSLYTKTLGLWVDQVIQMVKFADVLVRVRLYLDHPPSHLEKRLYANAGSMAKLYAADEQYKAYVLELFESLVKSSGSFSEEPPSLLGHLGSDCANHFVTLLSSLDKPYQDEGVEIRIWNFISAVVSNKQQGMSILLLRGEALRQGRTTAKPVKNKSMLQICFDALDEIDTLPVEKTLAMLEMISTALNFWTLAMDDLRKHPKILPGLTKHVESFNIEFLPADTKDVITEKACKVAIAAHIARILALYTHSRRPSDKDQTFFKQLIPRLKYYFDKAVKISGYRSSLHALLPKNFEEKWSGVKLAQFKKTRLRRTIYGPDAVYDIVLGDKVLGFDPTWAGRADGYRSEVQEANLNLSLVQTQVNLLSSWELLAVELCDFAKNSPDLAKSLTDVVVACLKENVETGLPSNVFSQILSRRADFAFVVVRKIHQALPESDHFSKVFTSALKAVHNSRAEFHHALTTTGMDYYRSLLRIIYISLTAICKKEKHSLEFGLLIVDLLDIVVARGFKDLVQAAHQHPDTANPADIALVTGILQAALRIKDINEIHTGLANHLHENQTIRAATTLFSWADQLASADGDPVYGELAVLFLLELSSVPVIAEQLALENVLELLMSSTLATRIAVGGITPHNNPRLHAIWSRGLLPLALNLLANIGTRYGREIVTFLKYFEAQLRTALEGWKKPSVVVLPAVNEVVGVGMILAIVNKMGGREELKGSVNIDTQVAADGVEYLLGHRNYLKSLVAPMSVDEEEMRDDLTEKVVIGLGTVQTLLQEEGEE
ncbi:nucleoporin subcomplex protein binding to Pom34-domain-containing protein [Pyronema domesticum]|nr:nucleoporin subcomplex protein binding to Pom34-domain-containing protein [Pyronema domesticum]